MQEYCMLTSATATVFSVDQCYRVLTLKHSKVLLRECYVLTSATLLSATACATVDQFYGDVRVTSVLQNTNVLTSTAIVLTAKCCTTVDQQCYRGVCWGFPRTRRSSSSRFILRNLKDWSITNKDIRNPSQYLCSQVRKIYRLMDFHKSCLDFFWESLKKVLGKMSSNWFQGYKKLLHFSHFCPPEFS